MSDLNIQEVIVCKTYTTGVHIVSSAFILYIPSKLVFL